MRRLHAAWLLLPLVLAACGDEAPLDVGSELLPSDALRSFEVTLEPDQFLVRDSSFALYGDVGDVGFVVLAQSFQGVLTAHEFARFQLPTAIGVNDTLGVSRTDSAYTILRGEVFLSVDSLALRDTVPGTRVALNAFGESWDTAGVSWEFRRTGERWTVPGGTPGALLDTALVKRDSIILQVDSATMRQWRDTTNTVRGALLSLVDAGTRLRVSTPVLRIYARSRYHPDTTVVVVAQAPGARFDYRPRLPTVASDIRFSGVPTWRSFLQFRTDMKDLSIPCGTGCTARLGTLGITRAELVLQPVTPPPGFTPELPIRPAAYRLLFAPPVPIQRTPIGAAIGTTMAALEPSRFTTGGAPAYVVLTDFVRGVVADTAADPVNRSWITLMAVDSLSIGVGTFAPGPRLRLVLSTAREIQLP